MRSISSQLRAFQSTPPVWEATFVDDPTGTPVTFQSTPPVWEATNGANIAPLPACFNPRLPCGRRLEYKGTQARVLEFQSTPPVWEATKLPLLHLLTKKFQSTPPVWEATRRECPS